MVRCCWALLRLALQGDLAGRGHFLLATVRAAQVRDRLLEASQLEEAFGLLELGLQRGHGQVPGHGVDVDKVHRGPTVQGRVGRCHETVRGCPHRGSRPHAQSQTSDVQPRGGVGHGERVLDLVALRKHLFEPGNGRALCQVVGAQHLDHGIDVRWLNLLPAVGNKRHGFPTGLIDLLADHVGGNQFAQRVDGQKVGVGAAVVSKTGGHRLATGGLADITLSDGDKAGQTVKTTLFPITLDGQRLGVRLDPPPLGAHCRELLAGIGYPDGDIDALTARGVVG